MAGGSSAVAWIERHAGITPAGLLVMFFVVAQVATFVVALVIGGSKVPLTMLPLVPAFSVSGLLFHPVITWTLRSKEEASQALRYCDQVTFEGYAP